MENKNHSIVEKGRAKYIQLDIKMGAKEVDYNNRDDAKQPKKTEWHTRQYTIGNLSSPMYVTI